MNSGKPRVLRVIARMNVGGPAKQITHLQRGLTELGYETVLLAGAPTTDEEDYVRLYGGADAVLVPHFGPKIDPRNEHRAFSAIQRHIQNFQPDIVHTHTAKAGTLGRLAAIRARTPHIVHTFHGHLLRGYYGRVGTGLVVAAERLLARRTTVICTVGRQVSEDLLQAGIGRAEQYELVPPGIPPPQTVERRMAREALALPLDDPVVAYVGRLTAVKRPDRLVAVAKLVSAAVPNCHFIIAGGGELLEETQREAARQRLPITFLGWTSEVDLVYSAADLMLLVSDNEGTPVSLIEASMAGVPAVTTDVGSAGEVVLHNHTGYVVDACPSAIAGATAELLNNRHMLDRFGAAARLHATTRYSLPQLVGKLDQLYMRLTG